MHLIKFPYLLFFLSSLSELGNSTDRPWERKQWKTTWNTWNQRLNWRTWSIRRKKFHDVLWKQNREKRDGNKQETVHRELLLFKYTSDKEARHSTEKENKKPKYFRNILNSQKNYSVRIVRMYNKEYALEKRHRTDRKWIKNQIYMEIQ